jgi:hypothetical protein
VKVAAHPFLDGNNFKADSASVVSNAAAGAVTQHE